METLKNYGVPEMNMKEMKEVEGGCTSLEVFGAVAMVFGLAYAIGFSAGVVYGLATQ